MLRAPAWTVRAGPTGSHNLDRGLEFSALERGEAPVAEHSALRGGAEPLSEVAPFSCRAAVSRCFHGCDVVAPKLGFGAFPWPARNLLSPDGPPTDAVNASRAHRKQGSDAGCTAASRVTPMVTPHRRSPVAQLRMMPLRAIQNRTQTRPPSRTGRARRVSLQLQPMSLQHGSLCGLVRQLGSGPSKMATSSVSAIPEGLGAVSQSCRFDSFGSSLRSSAALMSVHRTWSHDSQHYRHQR